MEQKAPRANDQIANEGKQEDRVMLILYTAEDTLEAKPHEHEIGESVDDFGGVDGRIVILQRCEMNIFTWSRRLDWLLSMICRQRYINWHRYAYLFAPIQSRRDRTPETDPGGRVRNGGEKGPKRHEIGSISVIMERSCCLLVSELEWKKGRKIRVSDVDASTMIRNKFTSSPITMHSLTVVR